jgi:hypothetical protein
MRVNLCGQGARSLYFDYKSGCRLWNRGDRRESRAIRRWIRESKPAVKYREKNRDIKHVDMAPRMSETTTTPSSYLRLYGTRLGVE